MQLRTIPSTDPAVIIVAIVFSRLKVLSIFSSKNEPKNSAFGSTFCQASLMASKEFAISAGATFT